MEGLSGFSGSISRRERCSLIGMNLAGEDEAAQVPVAWPEDKGYAELVRRYRKGDEDPSALLSS